MYEIQYRKDAFVRSTPMFKRIPTLELARRIRYEHGVSGDLVVESFTQQIIVSDSWLFDWERHDSKCYAKHAIARQIRANLLEKREEVKTGKFCWLFENTMYSKEAIVEYCFGIDDNRRYMARIAGHETSFRCAQPVSNGHPLYGFEADWFERDLGYKSVWIPDHNVEYEPFCVEDMDVCFKRI